MNRLSLRLGTVFLIVLLLVIILTGFANASTTYTVQKGDTLFLIGKKYGVTASAIKSANGLASDEIYPGQKLTIPSGTSTGASYTVVKGDSLFLIAKRFGVTVDSIRKANNLWTNTLYPGQTLYIPGVRSTTAGTLASRASRTTISVSRSLSRADINLLARVVYGEARGEIYEGQVAVAAVVLNRLRHPDFPKTIPGVIYEPYAFTAVSDGQINLTPDATAYKAVQDALNGWDPTNGALYYWNPATATSKWVWSRPIIKRIGNHVFAK